MSLDKKSVFLFLGMLALSIGSILNAVSWKRCGFEGGQGGKNLERTYFIGDTECFWGANFRADVSWDLLLEKK